MSLSTKCFKTEGSYFGTATLGIKNDIYEVNDTSKREIYMELAWVLVSFVFLLIMPKGEMCTNMHNPLDGELCVVYRREMTAAFFLSL